MDIYWYGQACFKIKAKFATIIIDPFESEFTGLKLPKDFEADIAIKTHDHKDHNNLSAITGSPVKVEGPGEYEIKGVAITGVQLFHDEKNGEERGKNTIFSIQVDGVNILHLGDLGHVLSDEQIEDIGPPDILMVPVGGTYTIDAKDASQVVSSLEPRIIIPMHFGGIPGLKFPLDPVEDFLKEMGVEKQEAQPKLSITKDKLPEEPQVIVLYKS